MDLVENGIDTGGGPLILVSRNMAKWWRGYDRPELDTLDPAHDYGRACGATRDRRAAKLAVGDAEALIIDCGEDAAFFHRHPSGTPVIVLWGAADSLEELLAAANEVDLDSEPDERLAFHVNQNELWLFDSAWSGDDADLKALPVPLGPYAHDLRVFFRSVDVHLTMLAFSR